MTSERETVTLGEIMQAVEDAREHAEPAVHGHYHAPIGEDVPHDQILQYIREGGQACFVGADGCHYGLRVSEADELELVIDEG